jgi:hypothetical protein
MIRRAAAFAAGLTALACGSAALAQGADYYRGGWRTASGASQIYEFVIDGGRVTGIACTQCADGTTLARIEGKFDEKDGLAFTVRHLKLDGSLGGEDHLRAKLANGQLLVSGTKAGGGAVNLVVIKDSRGPAPSAFPVAILPPGAPPVPIVRNAGGGGGAGGPPPAYAPPAPWRALTSADVVGVWLGFGTGMDKQYFLIRRDGDRLFGLACGRCDNPYTFGALDNFRIEGDTLTFDIEHQDWGDGDVLPFPRHVTAHIAMNEMRIDARRPDQANRPGIVSSLVGPIAIEATKGNVVGN